MDRRAIEYIRGMRGANASMAGGIGRGANVYLNPEMTGGLNMIAGFMGAPDFMSMDPATRRDLRFLAGFLAQNGWIPGGLYDAGDTYYNNVQALRATHQMDDRPEDVGYGAYALQQVMTSSVFAADGSTNYGFTGGLDGVTAMQLMSQFVRNDLQNKKYSITGEHVQLASGTTTLERAKSMERNVADLMANNVMHESDRQRYISARKSIDTTADETAARLYTQAQRMVEAKPDAYSGSDTEAKVRSAYKAMLADPNMLNAVIADKTELKKTFEEKTKEDANYLEKARSAYESMYKEGENSKVMQAAHDNLIRSAAAERMAGKDFSSVTGKAMFEDSSTASVGLDLVNNNLSTFLIGRTSEETVSRAADESLDKYIDRVAARVSEGGTGITEKSKEEAMRMLAAKRMVLGHMEEGQFGANMKTEGTIDEIIAQGGISSAEQEDLEKLKQLVQGGEMKLETFNNGVAEIQKRSHELFTEYGSTIQTLQSVFGTTSLDALKRHTAALNWGTLSDVKDMDRMQQGVKDVAGIAAASNRSMEAVLIERRDIVKALNALSGGAKYVSESEISEQQMAKQLSDADAGAGSRYTADERFTMRKRSHENAIQNFGAAAAAEELLRTRGDMFSDEDKATITSMISRVKAGLASDSETGRSNAAALSTELATIIENAGVDRDDIRRYANKNSSEIVNSSVTQAAALRFGQDLSNRRTATGADKFTAEEEEQGARIMRLRAGMFGSSLSDWKAFVKAAGATDDVFEAYLKDNGATGGMADSLRTLRKEMAAVDNTQLREAITSYEMPQVLVGDYARNKQLSALWDAERKGGMFEKSLVAGKGNIIGAMLKAANGGQVVDALDMAWAQAWNKMFDPANKARYGEGKTLEKRAEAINDYFAANRGAYGENAVAVELDAEGNTTVEGFRTLLEKGVGLVDAEGNLNDEGSQLLDRYETLRKEKGVMAANEFAQSTLESKGLDVRKTWDVMTVADKARVADQTMLIERSRKTLERINFTEALEDNKVTADEFKELIGKDRALGAFDENNVYKGPILELQGKKLEEIASTDGTKGLLNETAGSDGLTVAQDIMASRDTSDAQYGMWHTLEDFFNWAKSTFKGEQGATVGNNNATPPSADSTTTGGN